MLHFALSRLAASVVAFAAVLHVALFGRIEASAMLLDERKVTALRDARRIRPREPNARRYLAACISSVCLHFEYKEDT